MDILKSFLRIGVVLSLVATFSSCWTPVFNEEASLAVLTASKLRLEVQFAATLNQYVSNGVVIAYPSRDLPPSNVLVANLGNTEYSYSVFNRNGSTYNYSTSGQNDSSFLYALSDPEETIVQAGSISNYYVIFAPAIGTGTAYLYSGNPLILSNNYVSTSPQTLIGVTQGTLASSNNFSGLYVETDSTQIYYRNDSGTGFTSVGLSAPTSMTNFGISGTGWLAYDTANNYTFTNSVKSNGLYTTYQFTTSTNTNWKRSDRVVAYLNGTNELLTRDGNFYTICQPSGGIKFSFPAGRLRFTCEFWDSSSSTYRCFFTESIPSQSGNSLDYTIRVYTIATSNLSSLK